MTSDQIFIFKTIGLFYKQKQLNRKTEFNKVETVYTEITYIPSTIKLSLNTGHQHNAITANCNNKTLFT